MSSAQQIAKELETLSQQAIRLGYDSLFKPILIRQKISRLLRSQKKRKRCPGLTEDETELLNLLQKILKTFTKYRRQVLLEYFQEHKVIETYIETQTKKIIVPMEQWVNRIPRESESYFDDLGDRKERHRHEPSEETKERVRLMLEASCTMVTCKDGNVLGISRHSLRERGATNVPDTIEFPEIPLGAVSLFSELILQDKLDPWTPRRHSSYASYIPYISCSFGITHDSHGNTIQQAIENYLR